MHHGMFSIVFVFTLAGTFKYYIKTDIDEHHNCIV